MKTRAPTNPLAPIWHWLGGQAPEWWNTGVTFHGPTRILRVGGVRWMVHFNVHSHRRTARSRPYTTAVLSVLPRSWEEGNAARVKRGGWVRAIAREVRSHGYVGGWRNHRWGSAAIFVKELPSLEAVQAEVARVSDYDLAATLRGWVDRRITQGR